MEFFVFSTNTVFPIVPQTSFSCHSALICTNSRLTAQVRRRLGNVNKNKFFLPSALICTNSRLTAQVRRRLGYVNKNKFFLPFRSPCTNSRLTAQVRRRLGYVNKNKFFLPFRSPCTNFASAIKLPIFHPIISSTTQFFQVDYGSLHRTRFYRGVSVYRP